MDEQPCFYSVGKQDDDPFRVEEIKIRRSSFICSMAYVSSLEKAKEFIGKISKEHPTANHNCWAYIVGDRADMFHCSDAGEPAGTAGKPMLNTLNRYQMTCVAAVVTRYFGGVKLGIRGLIDAYCQSVEAAVLSAPLVALVPTCVFQVRLAYDFNDLFLQQIKDFSPKILHTEYLEAVTHHVEVRESVAEEFQEILVTYNLQSKLEFERLE